ncbi:MAG TPA: hypothetical protein VGD52_22810, partial [Pseudoduganella sp.]
RLAKQRTTRKHNDALRSHSSIFLKFWSQTQTRAGSLHRHRRFGDGDGFWAPERLIKSTITASLIHLSDDRMTVWESRLHSMKNTQFHGCSQPIGNAAAIENVA